MSGNLWRILGLISPNIISLSSIPSTLNNLVVDTASLNNQINKFNDARNCITEYADIVYVYGLCDGSSLRAITEYERSFPNRRVPYQRVFTVYGVG
ncbi:hypothetical protein ANN_25955 [Periplaneta americana]|uniref:DUF4817 domain-containing protein n=1 Tax=Periplaneta americana TaxID=6978 RepID=A0ABQ8S503_PERAM|nr:hypothetical protein ANN_25955 [Periplaneta americana]